VQKSFKKSKFDFGWVYVSASNYFLFPTFMCQPHVNNGHYFWVPRVVIVHKFDYLNRLNFWITKKTKNISSTYPMVIRALFKSWDPKIVAIVDMWSLFRGHLTNINNKHLRLGSIQNNNEKNSMHFSIVLYT